MEDAVLFQEEPRRYLYRGKSYRSVTDRIQAVGFGPDFSYVKPAHLEYCRQRGNAIDEALIYHYEGDLKPGSVDPAIEQYFLAALKFDGECPGPIVAVHPRLCSELLGVAGTPDLIRFIRGRRAVVDWKTGADNPLQTWMYMMLWNQAHPNHPAYERYGLRLKPSGAYVLKEHNDPDDSYASMAILTGNTLLIESYRRKYGNNGIRSQEH